MKLRYVPGLLVLAACGGPQAAPSAELDGSAGPADGFAVNIADDGRIVVDMPRSDARAVRWYRLRPAFWPETGAAPVLGVGTLHLDGDLVVATPWATRQIDGIETLRLEPAAGLEELVDSKELVGVTPIDDRHVTLAAGSVDGIREDDLFWLVAPPEDAERVGDSLVGLVRVDELGDHSAAAVVIHTEAALGDVSLAMFAQASSGLAGSAATVRVAPFSPDSTDAVIEPVRAALERFQVEYEVSNIAVEAIDAFVAPEPVTAARDVADAVRDDGFGVIAFGRAGAGEVVFNATAFGLPPHGAATVGILPGGLAVPAVDADELVAQIAPSLIASVLALRDEHALAVYLLERELRRDDLEPAVRYHLREHLALRYEALGMQSEALGLMSHDIATSQASGDARAQLNALSIRTLLDLRAGLAAQLLADAQAFLDVAAGVLPDEALGGERLLLADARIRSGDFDGGISIIREVLGTADATSDLELRSAAVVDLAYAMRLTGDPAAAIVISEMLGRGDELRPTARIALELAAADLYAADGDPQRAVQALERAVDLASTDSDTALAAGVFARCGNVFEALDELEAASEAYMRASEIYLERGESHDATDFLTRASFAAIGSAGRYAGQDGLRLMLTAYDGLSLAGEIALRRGDTLEAAQTLLVISMIQERLGSSQPAEAMLLEALELGRRSAHISTIVDSYERLADLADARGDASAALAYRDAALRWQSGELVGPPPVDEGPTF